MGIGLSIFKLNETNETLLEAISLCLIFILYSSLRERY